MGESAKTSQVYKIPPICIALMSSRELRHKSKFARGYRVAFHENYSARFELHSKFHLCGTVPSRNMPLISRIIEVESHKNCLCKSHSFTSLTSLRRLMKYSKTSFLTSLRVLRNKLLKKYVKKKCMLI